MCWFAHADRGRRMRLDSHQGQTGRESSEDLVVVGRLAYRHTGFVPRCRRRTNRSSRARRPLCLRRAQVGGDQPGLRSSGRTRPQLERQARQRGADRSGRVAHPVGSRLPPASHLLHSGMVDDRCRRRPTGARTIPAGVGRRGRRQRLVVDQNPFVGTQAFRGLVVLQWIPNNWDLKTVNNKVYTSDRGPGTERYVVRDLGASLGGARQFPLLQWLNIRQMQGTRNDLEAFESALPIGGSTSR